MSTDTAPPRPRRRATRRPAGTEARCRVYAVGLAAACPPCAGRCADADGLHPGRAADHPTDLPAFPTSSVDGWAVRGPGRGGWWGGCSPARRPRR